MEECEYWPPISVGQCGRLSFERWVAHRNNSESDSAGLTRGAPGSERTRREWNGDSLWDFSRHISAVKSWTEIYRFIHNSRYPLWPVRAAGRAASHAHDEGRDWNPRTQLYFQISDQQPEVSVMIESLGNYWEKVTSQPKVNKRFTYSLRT